MLPTIIAASVIGLIVVLIYARQIQNKRAGKGGCSCGGNCGACGMSCHRQKASDETKE
jgi:xanthine dehydrogenase iron-sulfur cluster and FAD-binding subunit A